MLFLWLRRLFSHFFWGNGLRFFDDLGFFNGLLFLNFLFWLFDIDLHNWINQFEMLCNIPPKDGTSTHNCCTRND